VDVWHRPRVLGSASPCSGSSTGGGLDTPLTPFAALDHRGLLVECRPRGYPRAVYRDPGRERWWGSRYTAHFVRGTRPPRRHSTTVMAGLPPPAILGPVAPRLRPQSAEAVAQARAALAA